MIISVYFFVVRGFAVLLLADFALLGAVLDVRLRCADALGL